MLAQVNSSLWQKHGPAWYLRVVGDDWYLGAKQDAFLYRWVPNLALVGLLLLVAATWIGLFAQLRQALRPVISIEAISGSKQLRGKVPLILIGSYLVIGAGAGGAFGMALAQMILAQNTNLGSPLPIIWAAIGLTAVGSLGIAGYLAWQTERDSGTWRPGRE